jgi:ribosome recycling factor
MIKSSSTRLDLDKIVIEKMQSALDTYKEELSSIHVGRPTISFLSKQYIKENSNLSCNIILKNVASLSVYDRSTLLAEFFDKDICFKFDKKIRECGLSTSLDGLRLKVFTQDIVGEKRVKLRKDVLLLEEQKKISVRVIRQTYNNKLKRLQKDNGIDETELNVLLKNIQTHTDNFVKKIVDMTKEKLKLL